MRGISNPDGRTVAPGLLRFARNDGQGIGSLVSACVSPKWRDRTRDAATRAFYQAVGFLPIGEFPDLRGAENPCLLMLRPLGFVGRPSCREMDCFAGPRDDGERLM